jgi:predicted RNA-binding Zn-ribbon protein involved in translation (DUF1610 family)
MKRWFAYWPLVALICVFFQAAVAAAEGNTCPASTYSCPNCGGIQVSDCQDCDGYLNTDLQHGICFQRHLFARKNDDLNDPKNHYHYLWRDLVAMFVWFTAAGVATACGLGGGGIYVVRFLKSGMAINHFLLTFLLLASRYPFVGLCTQTQLWTQSS